MTNKKNKFWTFCFSLIPGAGEMYLGFYKMGLSLMVLFWLTITISGTINIPVFIFILPPIWFYSFFHVHNLNSMPEEEFYTLEDRWLFQVDANGSTVDTWLRSHKKVVAVMMIIFGASFLWNLFNNFLYNVLDLFQFSEWASKLIKSISRSIPQTVIGIFIVYVGILLIRGKKADLDQEEDKDTVIPAPPYISYREIKESPKESEESTTNPAE